MFADIPFQIDWQVVWSSGCASSAFLQLLVAARPAARLGPAQFLDRPVRAHETSDVSYDIECILASLRRKSATHPSIKIRQKMALKAAQFWSALTGGGLAAGLTFYLYSLYLLYSSAICDYKDRDLQQNPFIEYHW
jgi:hypothetical protein